MNYSIILLGATISVSLFIRICGVCSALDVNSHSARGSDNYENWSPPNYKNEEGFRHDPVQNIPSMAYSFATGEEESHNNLTHTKTLASAEDCVEDYHHDICGEQPRCNKTKILTRPETHRVGARGIPKGCIYKDPVEKTSVICENVSTVPVLNVSLASFEIKESSFEELPANALGDVSIKSIMLRFNSFTRISPDAFADIENVNSLSIVNNEKLTYLPYDMYKGLNTLRYLNLDNNNINFTYYDECKERLVEDIPLVMTSLNFLSLDGNPLTKIPSQMWAGLRESPITALILKNCALVEVCPESFSFLKNLKTLYLGGNRYLNFKRTFEGLQNLTLENLQLSNNGFYTVPVDELAMVAHSLTTLDLSSNNFDRLSPSNFPTMTKLKELNLGNCKIRNIAEGTFEKLPNLISLDLRDNNLYSIPSTVFSLSRLMYLTLDNNAPFDPVGNNNPEFIIREEELRRFSLLSLLFINNTPLKQIKRGMFDGLSRLTNLYANNTKLSFIEDGAFSNTSLRTLFLSNNFLTEVRAKMFDGCENLTYLYLANNMISFPEPEMLLPDSTTGNPEKEEPLDDMEKLAPFSVLKSLEHLELQNNRIKHLYPELFSTMHKLANLDLSENQIETWEVPVFPTNHSETRRTLGSLSIKLDLSGNRIKKISDAILADLITFSPEFLDLSENQMICDKGSCALRDLMNDTTDFDFDVPTFVNWTDKNSYKCVHSKTKLTYLIKTISNETCISSGTFETQTPTEIEGTPNKMIIMIVGIVCGTCFFAGLLVVGYKKRIHLGYVFFKVKMNVRELPRKAKISEVEQPFNYDLFVSYHNQDRSFIIDKFLPEVEDPELTKNESSDYEVYKYSGQTGFRVCLHERDFEAGVPITENIVESVDKSRKVVIIVSKKYLESQWCLFEMNLAYHRLIEARRTSFVLVFLEQIPNSMRTKVLSYLMRSRTYLEWPGDAASLEEKTRFWTRLRTSLAD